LFFAGFLGSIGPAAAQPGYYMNATTAGCVMKDDLDLISRLAQEGDRVAFTKALATGACTDNLNAGVAVMKSAQDGA
jgi:hypothetical protein